VQKFNYHTHTYRCGHADRKLTDEDIVKEFVNKGFKKIAFTDHCPEKEVIEKRLNMRMKYSQKDEYLNSIKKLKEKYADVIEIETGFEVEYLPGKENNLIELKNETDKIILGQHFIYDDNKKLKIFRHHEFTDEDLIKYANYIEEAMKKGIPDIIAHPDIYMIGRHNFGEIETKVAHMICKSAEKYNIPLEINLSDPNLYLIGKKTRVRYPSKKFWKIASQYNLKVLYGIDAHYKNQIINYEENVEFVNKYIGEEIINNLNLIQ